MYFKIDLIYIFIFTPLKRIINNIMNAMSYKTPINTKPFHLNIIVCHRVFDLSSAICFLFLFCSLKTKVFWIHNLLKSCIGSTDRVPTVFLRTNSFEIR